MVTFLSERAYDRMVESWHCEFVTALNGCECQENLRSVVTEFFSCLELDKWMIGIQVPTSLSSPEVYGINNYDDLWWQQYVENRWIECDPIPRYCIDNHAPRLWSIDGWADEVGHRWEYDDPAAVGFFREVERFGARSGLVIPYHLGDNSRCLLNLPHPEPIEISRPLLVRARMSVFAVMPELMLAVQKVYRLLKGSALPNLTPREKEALFLVSEGFTSKEIAGQLGISPRTVDQYMMEVQRKLGVSNRLQAAAKAISLGLLIPKSSLDGMTYSVSAQRWYEYMK